MSILDTSIKLITPTFLKSQGLYMSYWGSPAGRKPSGKTYWYKDRKFYEGCWCGYKDTVAVWWFPKGFGGYVDPFYGPAPVGTLMVVPNNTDELIYSNIFTEMDFLTTKEQITKKYKIYKYDE